jgi:dihydrofolate synthase/folylpolyglutamate synthase
MIPKGHFKISDAHIKSGLLNVVKNTGLHGRWEILQHQPKIICDTAHNKEGLTYVMEQLKDENYQNLHIVFGVVNDKDLNSILPLMPKHATYYFCKPNIERGLDAEILKQTFNDYGIKGDSFLSVNMALMEVKKNAQFNDLIYVGGSTFVVAEII